MYSPQNGRCYGVDVQSPCESTFSGLMLTRSLERYINKKKLDACSSVRVIVERMYVLGEVISPRDFLHHSNSHRQLCLCPESLPCSAVLFKPDLIHLQIQCMKGMHGSPYLSSFAFVGDFHPSENTVRANGVYSKRPSGKV